MQKKKYRIFRTFRIENLIITKFGIKYSLHGRLWVGTEVDQETESHLGHLQVIQDLRLVDRGDGIHCLDFNNDFAVTHKICSISLVEQFFSIVQPKQFLGFEGNARESELSLETFLVHRFEEPAADFLVNGINGSTNGVTFVFENHVCHCSFF